MTTYEGWTLERTGPGDQYPQWRFTPLAPFGREPDLGPDRPGTTDRPPEPVPRERGGGARPSGVRGTTRTSAHRPWTG